MKWLFAFIAIYAAFELGMAYRARPEPWKYNTKQIQPAYYASKLISKDGEKCFMGNDPVPCSFYDDIQVPEVKHE
jgi:hypothetical protein